MRRIHLAVALLVTVLALQAPARSAPAITITNGFIKSFDGTPIAYTLFRSSTTKPAPVIFYTHGWAGHRQRSADGFVGSMLAAGYAVLTWDARGFGESGGEANVDSQTYEVRDVQKLITFVAHQSGILLDRRNDPRMGMAGGSYAGGIQLMVAAADSRVDAIAPEIAWNDLPQSLKPGGVTKLGWGALLYSAGVGTGTAEGLQSKAGPQTGSVAFEIHKAFVESTVTNDWSADTYRWFDARSPKHYISGVPHSNIRGVRIPTLIIQGASDNLFPMNEGIANARQVARNGVPVRMVFFCGGHSVNALGSSCVSKGSRTPDILAWFDRYLRHRAVDTGAPVSYQMQDGSFGSTSSLPAQAATGSGAGTLVFTAAPTSGEATAPQPSQDGIRIPVPANPGWTLLGIPRANVDITATASEAYLFFKLIDRDASGKETVIDDQVMSRKVTGLSQTKPVHFGVDLGGVSWHVAPGHSVQLEISSSSNDYATSRTPYIANVKATALVPHLTR
ncbi:MAG: hypothetical protein NVSMB57_16010 [Actinomycetota bacterium]